MCISQQKRTTAISREIYTSQPRLRNCDVQFATQINDNHEPWNVCIVKKTNEKALYNSLERLSSLWLLRLYCYPRDAAFILQAWNKVAQLTPARDGWLKIICLLKLIANPHSTKTYVVGAVPCYPTGAVHFGLPCTVIPEMQPSYCKLETSLRTWPLPAMVGSKSSACWNW